MAKRVADRRILKLIRGFLAAGVTADGLVGPTDEGTPQGGPLSPLLSNLMLDVLDKELTRRGHCFVRYADDCNIYVRSRRAGERVMTSVTSFVTKRLQLRVNTAKSAATPWQLAAMGTPGMDRPSRRKFLGFSFTAGKAPHPSGAVGTPRPHRGRRIAPQALIRLKTRVRELTRRTKGASLEQTIENLRIYLTGWVGYFGFCQTPSVHPMAACCHGDPGVLRELHQWLRRRLRAFAWKQWRNGWNRFRQMARRGVPRRLAAQTAGSVHGPWRIAASPALNIALSNADLAALGLPVMTPRAA